MAYYPLSSNVNDYSWNLINWTPYGITYSDGAVFNWMSSYVDLWLSTLLKLQVHTVSSWIKTDKNNIWWIYVKKWKTAWWHNIWYNLWLYEKWKICVRLKMAWASSFTDLRVTANFYDNNRHNIVYVKESSLLSLYMDWVLIWSTSTSTINYWWDFPASIWAEISSWTPERFLSWSVKNVIVENKARTAEEVLNYYNTSK